MESILTEERCRYCGFWHVTQDRVCCREAKMHATLHRIAVLECECGMPCDCYSWTGLRSDARKAIDLPDPYGNEVLRVALAGKTPDKMGWLAEVKADIDRQYNSLPPSIQREIDDCAGRA